MNIRLLRVIAIMATLAMSVSVAAGAAPEAGPGAPDWSAIYAPGGTAPAKTAVPATPGPHLLVDDFLIASSHNLARRVRQPERDAGLPNPIVRGREDGCYQPYFSVWRNTQSGQYRIWFGVPDQQRSGIVSHVACMDSDDGINWRRPARVLKDPSPIQFGSEVIDRGPACKDPARRFILSYWHGSGLRLAGSADGLDFRPVTDEVVIRHNHDINNVVWDDLRNRFVATLSVNFDSPHFKGNRRTTFQSFSDDLLHWSKPGIVLRADGALDEGDTQFYAMNGYLTRGPLRLGMVKVLRDDLFSDTKGVLAQRGGGYGTGYTTLAWTRDGQHWVRDREVFFDRGPIGAWDRSHAWIDEQVLVGEQVYLYYAGYRSGHKADRFESRQIGLVKMPRDRYVARRPAKPGEAMLVTVPLRMNGAFKRLLLNASAKGGSIRVSVRAGNKPLAGLELTQCGAVTGDGVALPVVWTDAARTARLLAALTDQTITLEFRIENASLYAFEFAP